MMNGQIDIEEVTSRKTSETFPNIVIAHPNDTLPVVIRTLVKGDLQLICESRGQRKVIDRIDVSAYNIDYLLRTVGTLYYNVGPNTSIEIKDIETYLSCLV